MARIKVLSPSARSALPQKPLAPRPTSLKGKKIGLLFNSKPNADIFLGRMGEVISAKHEPAEVELLNCRRMFFPLPADFQAVFDKERDCMIGAWGD